MNLLAYIVIYVLILSVVAHFIVAAVARRNGTIKKQNVLARLIDALNVRVLSFFGVVLDAVTDQVASAEINIKLANQHLEQFEDEIINLRQEVNVHRKSLPRLQDEVTKWERLYVKAHNAGDEASANEAARRLKTSDARLKNTTSLLAENESVLQKLEDQKRELKDNLSNADVLKERLAAQKTSAELRQKAQARGASANLGLGLLKDLEDEVNRSEARAEAMEHENKLETSIEDKYADVDTVHEDRLASLLK